MVTLLLSKGAFINGRDKKEVGPALKLRIEIQRHADVLQLLYIVDRDDVVVGRCHVTCSTSAYSVPVRGCDISMRTMNERSADPPAGQRMEKVVSTGTIAHRGVVFQAARRRCCCKSLCVVIHTLSLSLSLLHPTPPTHTQTHQHTHPRPKMREEEGCVKPLFNTCCWYPRRGILAAF